jgi:hypothetical protein
MAKLFKAGGRRPRVEDGPSYASNGYNSTARELTYKLEVAEPWTGAGQKNRISYTAELSEDEMLYTVMQWMSSYTADVKRRKEIERSKEGSAHA